MITIKDIRKGGLYKKGKSVYFVALSISVYYKILDDELRTVRDVYTKKDVLDFLGKKATYEGQLKDILDKELTSMKLKKILQAKKEI
jgi:hypothetical protein